MHIVQIVFMLKHTVIFTNSTIDVHIYDQITAAVDTSYHNVG